MDPTSLSALAAAVSALAAIVALVVAVATAIFAYRQTEAARGQWRVAERQMEEVRKAQRGEFLLHLDEMFRAHNDVHTRLRPGGSWADGDKGPVEVEEWVALEQYMGLFERIQLLTEEEIIGLPVIDRLYGYRLTNIANHPIIRDKKLLSEARGWRDFISLWHDIAVRRRGEHDRIVRRDGQIVREANGDPRLVPCPTCDGAAGKVASVGGR